VRGAFGGDLAATRVKVWKWQLKISDHGVVHAWEPTAFGTEKRDELRKLRKPTL
jgi:hypothetical protein